MWSKGNPHALLVGMQTGAATVENNMDFPQNTKNRTAYLSRDSTGINMILLGSYPRNPETPIYKELCTPMFIAVLFTIAKCWEHPKFPSVNEWIKNLWYIYTMEYYSALNKEILPFTAAWMDL